MSEFINGQPPVAEQLRDAVTSVKDEVFALTKQVYGQTAVHRELDEIEIETGAILGLSDEEYEAFKATDDLDSMTPEEFEAYSASARLLAEEERSPLEFQVRVLSKANQIFGTISGYRVELQDSSAAGIVFTKPPDIDTTPEDVDDVSKTYVSKRLILDGAEVRVVNRMCRLTNGVTQEKVELPAEAGDETFPQETLQRFGEVSLFMAGLRTAVMQNGNRPPVGFFEY